MTTRNDETPMLRFFTAGSVDDGKSTLIGRLMFDTKTIFEDQLEAVEKSSKKRGDERLDLALLTDGLRAEREQGITIDVAYRYFATPRRKFIVADTPGHVQYTRNMVTGASTAQLAILLADARKGILEQTRRHAFISTLLGIKNIVVCVNKMDLVDWSEDAFDAVVRDVQAFASKLDVSNITFIPISALHGDNVIERSQNMAWYEGPSLLYHLEHVHVGGETNLVDARFPVQTVIRPHSDEWHDFRGYAGQVQGGVFKPGDEVVALPSGFTTRIEKIRLVDRELDEAFWPMSVVMTLEDEIDISRGDMIAKPQNRPEADQDLTLMVCWFSPNKPLQARSRWAVRHTTQEARAIVQELHYKVDVNSLHRVEGNVESLQLNDIGRVTLRTSAPLFHDPYRRNRMTGSVILVDELTNETVGAGMIR